MCYILKYCSPFIFRSIIPLKIMFAFDVRHWSIFMFFPHRCITISPNTIFFKKTFFYPLFYSATFVINHVYICVDMFPSL